ncbi:MAG: mycofactocin precursor [Desulfobacteraceae bacterium]|jgi:mycofactocin precursor|nr:MAG: mycofactocin precursor [Desulfobacteraceae bacterium]
MEKQENEQTEKAREVKHPQNDSQEDDIFSTEEIKIEEIAIDGVCGVY